MEKNLGGLIREEGVELGVEILHEVSSVLLDNLSLSLGSGR